MARSDNWRINKSSIMAVEGAQVLKALQKVAGAAGLPKDFKVKFATESRSSGIDFDSKELVIGAGKLFKEAPVPAELFDVLVGLTLHEVGHEQIDTAKIADLYKRESASMIKLEADVFQKFINIGEDIVIESRTRADPNLAEYDEALHKWGVSQSRDAQPNNLLEIWLEYSLVHKSTSVMNLPDELVEPMQQLVALTGWLRRAGEGDGKFLSMTHQRFSSYIRYWATVREAMLEPPKPDPQSNSQSDEQGEPDKQSTDGQSGDSSPQNETPKASSPNPVPEPPSDSGAEPQTPQSKDEVDVDGGDENSAPEPDDGSNQAGSASDVMDRPLAPSPEDAIDNELAEAIEDAIESDLEDVTEQVAEELGEQQQDGKYHKAHTVIRSRETKTPLIKPDPILRKKLERVMTIRKRLQARTMHGEQYGRIDKRHLHRIATDERIFSLRYKFPDGFPNTRILIDLSSSMSGTQADEVLEAAGALQTLVNAEVWCYNNVDNKVNLVRMDEGKLVHRFKPAGNTPSGLAIVGVSLGMKKGGLVIHLTDGEHNSGQTPWTAHWILKKNGIDLVNLIWGSCTRHYNLDGIGFRQLSGLAEFPEVLYQILVEQMKLSKIGGK